MIMKKLLTVLVLMISVLVFSETANALSSDTGVMTGKIGNYNVKMELSFNTSTGRVTGYYYYTSKGSKNKIQLSGTIKGEPFDGSSITLTETVKGKKTGTFKGEFWLTYSGASEFSGNWTSPSGKSMRFNVSH